MVRPEISWLLPVSAFEREEVEALIRGLFFFGKLHLVDGNPGVGKTFLLIALLAALSSGGTWGGTSLRANLGASIYLSFEDAPEDVLRPRLEAMGADLGCIFVQSLKASLNAQLSPAQIERLRRDVVAKKAKIVVIDSLMAALPSGVDSNKDQSVRQTLGPLAEMAKETGACVIIVRHLNKKGGLAAIYRGAGSVGINGVARSVMMVAHDPNDRSTVVLASTKCNLAKAPDPLAFRIEDGAQGPQVVFIGHRPDLTADALVAPLPPSVGALSRSKLEVAEDFLRKTLEEGRMPSKELVRLANGAGIAAGTLRRAAEAIGVLRSKEGGDGKAHGSWFMALPVEAEQGVQDEQGE